ncbi:PilX N-terminal domain-containing pilus assembly protein [Herbaspirillum huttiense]|uniref:pilus assembly PilX family protein n=1 Tax=Herbaspirillum huttiense TaxID=863372 RepID=UPI000585B7DD|nr:PilX N-terminal domain-containing pilus assembly protein [Herbaspirillum huttiense]
MKRPPCHPRQRGATLMITLMLLSVILLLGAATTSLLLLEERGARNHRERAQARLAAQAALEDACDDLRYHRQIDPGQFTARRACRSDAAGAGLCVGQHDRAGWEPAQLHGPDALSATYGQFTGRRYRALPGVATPRYLIERLLPTVDKNKSYPDQPLTLRYRLSAVGYGRQGAAVALQAVLQLPPQGQALPSACPLRAWRPLYLPLTE